MGDDIPDDEMNDEVGDQFDLEDEGNKKKGKNIKKPEKQMPKKEEKP